MDEQYLKKLKLLAEYWGAGCDGEDIVHNACLEILESGRDLAANRGDLFLRVRNRAMSYAKRSVRHKELEKEHALKENILLRWFTPEDDARGAELFREIGEKTREADAEVIWARVAGFSPKEIAEATGLSLVGAHRARVRVKEAMADRNPLTRG